MPKREFAGSSEIGPEQGGERKKLFKELERLSNETPETEETRAALIVLNNLLGAMSVNEEEELAALSLKFGDESRRKIEARRNEHN
ncbi:MAG: hypothetical protein PHS62_02470 [Patescibacteria group bacterium]|nr:hypothetical protein [Patescibacteria group bacterium]